MRLTTWNVNGIRNPFSYPPWNNTRTFPSMFDILEADIIVMQELKIQRKDLRDDMVLLDGWDAYFSLPKHKKGYSGVGIYTRNDTCSPIRAEEGLLGVLPSSSGVPYCELPDDKSIGGYPTEFQVAELGIDPAALDAEGRCLILEFPAFVLFGVYSPANSNGLRDDFRHGFILALDCRIRNLIRAGKRVVLVGDLNVSRDEQDTAKAAEDCRKNGVTHEEYISTPNRRIFNQMLIDGEVTGERDEGRENGVLWDTTRGFHPQRRGMYTHWEQKINARPGNYGSRIDFVLVSEGMQSWVKDANIQEGLFGSDHCPVFADFHDNVKIGENDKAILDIMNPPSVFESSIRQKDWNLQNVPAFSARRMPEFDKRRSIKSMFFQKAKSSVGDSLANHEQASQGPTTPLESPQKLSKTLSPQANSNHPLSEQDTSLSISSKRKLPLAKKEKPLKKQRTDNSAQSPDKAQQSLKGFFQSQAKTANKTAQDPAANDSIDEEKERPSRSIADSIALGSQDLTDSKLDAPLVPRSPSPSNIAAQVAAVEESQRSWSALFAKRAAPLCEGHNEPCKTMQTRKKGSNQGRSFWMCARPLGPSGEKEIGTQWRCRTFIWCSDWTGLNTEGEQE